MSPPEGFNRPPIMPLMPAMRPLNRINTLAATPINMPPASDDQGVKDCQSIDIMFPWRVCGLLYHYGRGRCLADYAALIRPTWFSGFTGGACARFWRLRANIWLG